MSLPRSTLLVLLLSSSSDRTNGLKVLVPLLRLEKAFLVKALSEIGAGLGIFCSSSSWLACWRAEAALAAWYSAARALAPSMLPVILIRVSLRTCFYLDELEDLPVLAVMRQ